MQKLRKVWVFQYPQSGAYRGRTQLSKRGNSRLRSALWMAARCASQMSENTFRHKFSRYVQSDPANTDLRRKAYTACTAKMARTIYGLIKHNSFIALTMKTQSRNPVEELAHTGR